MADISLTSTMRSNLLSLQNTQSLMDQTQERLSTGKKVNSAIDNPSSYYAARSLNNRASDLNALLDSMGQGIQTIKAADEGIEAITSFVEQAKAVINTARDASATTTFTPKPSTGTFAADAAAATKKSLTFTLNGTTKTLEFNNAGTGEDITKLKDNMQAALQAIDDGFTVTEDAGRLVVSNSKPGVTYTISGTVNGLTFNDAKPVTKVSDRVAAEKQFNQILKQIDQLAKDSGYKGVNLLQSQNLTVNFNEDRSSSLQVTGKDGSTVGLGLTAAAGWDNADNVALEAAQGQVDGAINTLRNWASEFGNNYSVLQSREDFTEKLVNVLTEGADKLTLADMNEESANMLALQTRQQLAINSLSLASQAAQSVLKLF